MYSIELPHPKYELSRYSTKQLLVWLEDCELVRCIEWQSYLQKGGNEAAAHYGNAVQAAKVGSSIEMILNSRNEWDAADRAIRLTNEDFNS